VEESYARMRVHTFELIEHNGGAAANKIAE
jgi:hypothetical protein